MPDFIVRSRKLNPQFAVRLANCTVEHAQSVVDQLVKEPVAPDDLFAEQVEYLYGEPAPRKPWYRRFLNG